MIKEKKINNSKSIEIPKENFDNLMIYAKFSKGIKFIYWFYLLLGIGSILLAILYGIFLFGGAIQFIGAFIIVYLGISLFFLMFVLSVLPIILIIIGIYFIKLANDLRKGKQKALIAVRITSFFFSVLTLFLTSFILKMELNLIDPFFFSILIIMISFSLIFLIITYYLFRSKTIKYFCVN